jgi:hypothetical protein
MDTFWIYKPNILWENYYEILPTSKMSRTKQMNTISRLIIYIIILTILFEKDSTLVLIGITALIIIVIFYYVNKSDIQGVGKDIQMESKDEIEKYTSVNNNCKDNDCRKYNKWDSKTNDNVNPLVKSIVNIYDDAKNKITKNMPIDNGVNDDANIEVESGYIDFSGNYKIGQDYSDINYKEYEKQNIPTISYDKNKYYSDNTCRKPTAENPWANIVFSDYLDAENIPEPCNVDDSKINNDMQKLYNSTIYRNIDDVFERENSQRIFYTVPIVTIPNKQTEFANWLYKTGPTCKENSNNCTYFEEPYMVSPRY